MYAVRFNRGVAQLVARLTGGQEAASSSLVTPTRKSLDAVCVPDSFRYPHFRPRRSCDAIGRWRDKAARRCLAALRCVVSRRIGEGFPLDSHYLKGFFKGGKGVGLSLYRLPAFCHADSLIPADRFLRKEKSSLLRAGYSLRRR